MSGSTGGVRVTLALELPDGPPAVVIDRSVDGPTADGELLATSLTRLDQEHGLLRDEHSEQHRLLLLDVDQEAAGTGGAVPLGVERREVVVDGWRIEVLLEPEARAALRERARRGRSEAGSSGPTKVHAIIPGVVVSVSVAPGDAVTAGQQLLVVEAMKMQNELRAPRDGTIEQVAVGAGSTIEVGDLLLVLA
jgi:biotin carboxyl carrier protein